MKPKLSGKIQELVTTLKSKNHWDNEEIVRLIEKLSIQQSDIEAFQKFNHNKNLSYGREPIYTCSQFKLLLMSWDVADVTAIHDHGKTDWGGVLFFGDTAHRLYEEEGNKLILKLKNTVPKGTFVPVTGSVVHMMSNQTNESFATMHLYGHNALLKPDEDKAIVYQPEFNKKVYTPGCAYVNMEKNLILDESPMPEMSKSDYGDYLSMVTPFYERTDTLHLIQK